MKQQKPDLGKVAICAIFKNEGPYIIEWLAYHIAAGVDDFFIADNESTDGSSALLKDLHSLGIIKYLHFPSPQDEAPQLPAYRKLMELYGNEASWVAFIDADEFLSPAEGKTIKCVLSDVASKDEKIGAMAINWANYGSAGELDYHPKLVVERFVKRAKLDFEVHRHYKSIVKVDAYSATHDNPHLFRLAPGFFYVHPDGHIMNDSATGIKGLSEYVCWKNLRLNHYIVKSYGEFLSKRSRGRATVKENAGLNRTDDFFHAHDTNEEHDAPPEALVSQIKVLIDSIEQRLKQHGTSSGLLSLRPEKDVEITAVIDGWELVGDNLTVFGWAFSTDLASLSFSIKYDNNQVAPKTIDIIDRESVAQHVCGAPVNCGFKITLVASELSNGRTHEIALVIATATNVVELPLQI